MKSLTRRSAADAHRVASGRTVSKAAPASRACIHKADRARRHTQESAVDAVLGIDIAKAKFDVALLLPQGKLRRKSCPNSPAGFAELTQWLRRQGAPLVHAALEATGTYGDALAHYLHDAGHVVSVLNPAVTHAYAASQLARAKTDRIDAELIARYTATQHPPIWTPAPREVRELQALIRRIDALQQMKTQEANRLEAMPTSDRVRTSLEIVIATPTAEIKAVQKEIRDHLDQHPGLRDQRDLLTSIPGIGEATAAVLIAELFEKRYHSARQAAAFAGVVPRVCESGTLKARGRLV